MKPLHSMKSSEPINKYRLSYNDQSYNETIRYYRTPPLYTPSAVSGASGPNVRTLEVNDHAPHLLRARAPHWISTTADPVMH